MTMLNKLTFATMGYFGGAPFLPGAAGRGDPPSFRMVRTAVLGSDLSVVTDNGSREFYDWLWFEDWLDLDIGGPFNVNLEQRFTDTDGSILNPIVGTKTCYSMRVYYRSDEDAIIAPPGVHPTVFRFAKADGDPGKTWGFGLSQYVAIPSFGMPPSVHKPLIFTAPGGGTSSFVTNGDAPLFSDIFEQQTYELGTAPWRLEVQVDALRTPKVVIRIYPPDSTVADTRKSLSGSPADVAMDRLYFGDDNRDDYYQKAFKIGQVEIHDDYDLGGQFTSNPARPTAASLTAVGAPVRRKQMRYGILDREAGEIKPAKVGGVKMPVGVNTSRTKFSNLMRRFVQPPAFVEHGWWLDDYEADDIDPIFWYGGDRRLALYYPEGAAPDGGWPVFMWAHSGFFSYGTYRSIPRAFVYQLLAKGFAVVSVEYVRSNVIILDEPYSGGQYPTFYLDYKNCARWLQMHGHTAGGGNGDYPLNMAKAIFGGYSAGGNIGTGAMASRDLADDGTGISLRCRDNAWSQVHPTAPDLEPLAAVCWGGPIDMQIAVDEDYTNPDYGSIMTVAAKAFMGRTQSEPLPPMGHTGITNMIARNAANLKPILYYRGGSDHLVIEEHVTALESALATHRPDLMYERKMMGEDHRGEIHDRLMDAVNYSHLWRFLDQVPGL